MRIAWGVSWDDTKKARAFAIALVPMLMLSLAPPAQRTAMADDLAASTDKMVSVIVQHVAGGGSTAEELVESLGGNIKLDLEIISGFSADVPRAAMDDLRASSSVQAVTKDYPLYVQSLGDLVDDTVSDTTEIVTDTTEVVTDTTEVVTDTTEVVTDTTEVVTDTTETVTDTSTGTTDPSNSGATDPSNSGTSTAETSTSFDGSMYKLQETTGTRTFWRDGYCGQGVDVALIDTGVVPVNGLTYPGKVINGPDFSFEANDTNVRYMDTNGHGTHMAGIIAGRDNGASIDADNTYGFYGMAPCSRIVNIKVANAAGMTDVSQVIAGIAWTIQHRNDKSMGLNIKVLNLSFGTDGTQDYRFDPLTFAVEQAWHNGLTVVVAAGNQQFGSTALNNPAYDPYIIAVGANDTKGTSTVADDTIPEWSARGDNKRNPDFVAPGKSIVSLRAPGSVIDVHYGSTGLVGERFFKGSGTSQASAAVAGAAALIHSQRPGITPDQVKGLLVQSAKKLKYADATAQGAGMIDMHLAAKFKTPAYVQTFPRAVGTGSINLARGTQKPVSVDGTVLDGEYDILGQAWNPVLYSMNGAGWSGAGWSGAGWSGAGWSGAGWSGAGWSGAGWSGAGWSGAGWSGAGWSGAGWSGAGWSGASWSGAGWSGAGWSGASWSGAGWSGAGWSGAGWSGAGWSGAGWSGAGWSGAGWSGAGWS